MMNHDVLIVGGGPAGLSAALVLSRARRTVAVIDAGEPRNAAASRMHGFLSRDGMAPSALLASGRDEIARYGATSIDGSVEAIEPGFTVRLASGAVLGARRILIASGLRDELPDIPGVRERWGRDVLHCPYCHGYEVRDQPIGVIGGGSEAVAHAALIRQWSPDVVLFPHRDALDADQRELLAARGVRIAVGAIARIVVDGDALQGVQLAGGELVPRTAVFVRPRMVADSGLLVRLGAATDEQGWVRQDAVGRTSVAGVYVAGNAADPRAQVITAAGQGSATAIAINADLVEDDVAHALTAYRAR